MSPKPKTPKKPAQEDPSEIIARHASFCSIFADEKRLRIMWLLREGERTVSEIAEHLGVSAQNISQHLRLMRDRNALATRREGQFIYYRISNQKFVEGAALIRQGVVEELNRMGNQSDDDT